MLDFGTKREKRINDRVKGTVSVSALSIQVRLVLIYSTGSSNRLDVFLISPKNLPPNLYPDATLIFRSITFYNLGVIF